MAIDLSQFYQVFFEESAEHLATMETLLLGLNTSNPSMDDLNAIFRAAHSIKGGAGTFGFTDMTAVTHVLETLLDKLRKQEMSLTDEMVTAFLEAGDVISMQLAAHRGEGEVDETQVKAICGKLEQLTGSGAAPPLAAPHPAEDTGRPQEEAYGFFSDEPAPPAAPADAGYGFFDDDEDFGTPPAKAEEENDPGYGFFEDTPPPSSSTPEDSQGYGFFTELPMQQAEREAMQGYGFFQELPPIPAGTATAPSPAVVSPSQPTPAKHTADKAPTPSQADSSVRVSVEKIDQLINLAGELVITQAMLAQAGSGNEALQHGLHQLERNTRDLQEAVMSIRMLPISFVFSRFPRLVRDLAGKLGKQVELKTVGENTELDKGLIEKISDPMTHLVRNSLDHGIESPENRIAKGKDAKGTITLKAYHQGGNVVIEVSDDGSGLNRSRILAKAKERGIPVNDEMPDQEVWQLIMAPGFSTAETVTDISGRGVGMDVVKRNITELGGRLELDSVEGFGSRTIIRLPLTLAILDGLSVSVGPETYIIPLNTIIESLQVAETDHKTVSGENELLRVRGEYLPLVRVHEVFNIKPQADTLDKGIAVIIEGEGRKIALFVDELLGQHQVVIKSLESNFRKVHGISGATIMGDGRVALILDIAALVAHSTRVVA